MAVLTKSAIDQRLQHLQNSLLDQAVHHGGYPQLTFAAIWLGNADATHWTGPIRACHQLVSDVRPCVRPMAAGLRDVHAIHACGTFVCLHTFPRAVHVLSRKRLLKQGLPCISLAMPREASFVADQVADGFTVRYRDSPRSRRHRCSAFLIDMVVNAPSRSALRPRLRLLRPLLTSRSGSHRRPFRNEARSPKVRTPPSLHKRRIYATLPLTTRALRFLARSPCSAAPSIRFLFIGSQESAHAGRTKKNAPKGVFRKAWQLTVRSSARRWCRACGSRSPTRCRTTTTPSPGGPRLSSGWSRSSTRPGCG
ncbi:MAG: hypothetical protein JWP72_1499 [Massilia sp.]|nr:hypothetical protein [Massilia sp.]MDB5792047.1 hypothetical protein [Massilia sp.]